MPRAGCPVEASDPPCSARHQGDGAGGATTGGRSLHVMVFGSSHGAIQGPVVFTPLESFPPRSTSENSEPAGVKLNEPQLFTPTAPTLRASTFSKEAEPATRALTTEVPVPSTRTSSKWTFEIDTWSFTGQSDTSMIALKVLSRKSPETRMSAWSIERSSA